MPIIPKHGTYPMYLQSTKFLQKLKIEDLYQTSNDLISFCHEKKAYNTYRTKTFGDFLHCHFWLSLGDLMKNEVYLANIHDALKYNFHFLCFCITYQEFNCLPDMLQLVPCWIQMLDVVQHKFTTIKIMEFQEVMDTEA